PVAAIVTGQLYAARQSQPTNPGRRVAPSMRSHSEVIFLQLLQGDCLELLKDIPDGSVDMVLTDPPYSSGGLFAGDRKASTRTKYCDGDYNCAARFQNFSGDNMDQRSF